jgi:hypothetical protein
MYVSKIRTYKGWTEGSLKFLMSVVPTCGVIILIEFSFLDTGN